MTAFTVGIICVIAMFVMIFLRVPIAISMAVPGILGAAYIRDWDAIGNVLNTVVWSQSANYIFSTIPMFIFMGELLFASRITTELYDSLRKIFVGLPGGLAITTIGASAVFAATAGSSIASTGTMGLIATNEMRKVGYKDTLASGAVVAGGTLGILIPPSTAFILYGLIAEQSIGQLLIAGIIPGIILTILYMLTIYISTLINPSLAPKQAEKYTLKEKIHSLKSTFWFFVLFAVVIGGMYAGIFSATEAAGIGAFGALVLCFLRGKLTKGNLKTALLRTVNISSFMFAVILGAYILNYLLALTKLPMMLAGLITESGLSRMSILLLIILLFIFLGMVMDLVAMMVVTMPIILPTLVSLNFDLIWFGVICVILIEMALITPPVGVNCFVLKGAVPDLELGDIFKGALRFVIPLVILLTIIILFPKIALFLPTLMM